MIDDRVDAAISQALRRPDAEQFYCNAGSSERSCGRSLSSKGGNCLRRRQLIKVLRRHGKCCPRALRLAEKLEGCKRWRRCLSGGCPECRGAVQTLCVDEFEDILARFGRKTCVVSVIFWKDRISDFALASEPTPFLNLEQNLVRAWTAAGVPWAFGGFDISANEHAEHRFMPHYRPHAWIIVPAATMARGEREFREFFPASATVRRPVWVKAFDGDRRGLEYALKTEFNRRITLPRQVRPSGLVARRNTRNRPLLARQKVEIALALDRTGLGSRVFLHGLTMTSVHGRIQINRARSEDGRNPRHHVNDLKGDKRTAP